MSVEDRYTGGEYARLNPDWHASDAPFKAGWVAEMLRPLAPRSVCDVGCGSGALLVELASTLGDVDLVGFDIAPDAVALARQSGVDARLGPIEGSYDVVLLIDVVEHVLDPVGLLREAAAHAPFVLAHIPLELSLQTVWRQTPLIESRARVGHLHFFTERTARALVTEAGLVVRDSRFTPTGLVSPGSGVGLVARRLTDAVSRRLSARVLGGYSLLLLCEKGP